MPKKVERLPKLQGVQSRSFAFEPQGFGFFFRFGWNPEDRNPWNLFLSGGIGGRGAIPGRPYDRYGVGSYAQVASEDLRNQPGVGGELDTEWGLEVFYNFAITPWLQFTPDFQYIHSGLPGVGDTVVLATRIQMYF